MKVRKRRRDSETGSPVASSEELQEFELPGDSKEIDGSLVAAGAYHQSVDETSMPDFAGFASSCAETEKFGSLEVDGDPMIAFDISACDEKKDASLEAGSSLIICSESKERKGGSLENDGGCIVNAVVAVEKTGEENGCLEAVNGSINVSESAREKDGSLVAEIDAIFAIESNEKKDDSFVAFSEPIASIESSGMNAGSFLAESGTMVSVEITERDNALLGVSGDLILVEDADKALMEKVGDGSAIVTPKKAPVPRSSSYHGVTKHRWSGKFEAHLWDGTINIESRRRKGKQGGYDTEEDAARAYDLAALKYWGPNSSTKLNFPISEYEKELEEMTSMSQDEWIQCLRRRSRSFSRGISSYRGVTRRGKDGKWQARLGSVAGTRAIFLGAFDTEEEAAIAYDIGLIKLRGLNAITNFNISNYTDLIDR
ncbi:AP2-like ethylene-responsive transcription factor domain-containing protein [Dioscorea alata]|uniref:AP2-like ethylene-responsive transcription factor domain-containing protein n=1 Tax=Dioscorea alata TaxID=55571 RepID=A0ACB7TX07_DIOAL|nr:AP2-like ethylene-responsive transcription factor domain-containing protein [Dioscorea alata]